MGQKRKRADAAWEYCTIVDCNMYHVQCNFCEHKMWGGITRFKQHLAHVKGEVIACEKCPPHLSLQIQENLKQHAKEKEELKQKTLETKERVMRLGIIPEVWPEEEEGAVGVQEEDVSERERQEKLDAYIDSQEQFLFEHALEESLHALELDTKGERFDPNDDNGGEDDFLAGCMESMRSYKDELLRRDEGPSNFHDMIVDDSGSDLGF